MWAGAGGTAAGGFQGRAVRVGVSLQPKHLKDIFLSSISPGSE